MEGWALAMRVAHYAVLVLTVALSVWASGHALAFKRDPRAATLWIGVIWLLPLTGAVLYFLFGVNRIRRWAETLRAGIQRFRAPLERWACPSDDLARYLGPRNAHLARLARAVEVVSDRPLVGGNQITVLANGDTAYPAMLEAIHAAERSVTLSTYIFDADRTGLEFVEALGGAVRRGVEVRVLVDATGMRYSWPSIAGYLGREGVRYARFLRLFPLWRTVTMNLRNHRKILVVDGRTGFTGGMNIRDGHWISRHPRSPVQDLQFKVRGPVVAQLQEVFADDWEFTTGEVLRGPTWFPEPSGAGDLVARGVADGPDEDFERLRWVMLAAISSAERSIRIATPYFLPDGSLIAALNVAAMRGVAVEVLLPEANNLPFVHWASRAHWWQVLAHGCRLWLSPPPFDHSKLMLIDGAWVLVGSANWDPRSLRLNFEFNLECYDPGLGGSLETWFAGQRGAAREVTLAEVDARGLGARLRDGAARLFTPFL